jgi:hypothetical protein
MTIRVPRIRAGEVIEARWLNDVVDGVNTALQPPRAEDDPPPPQPEEGDDESAADEHWTEVARTTTTVRVEDPDDSDTYVDVERVDTVTFLRPDGTTIRLTMSN